MMQPKKLTGHVFRSFDPRMEDHLYFLLKNNLGEFTIGLKEILQCLQYAEKQGEVPHLSEDWWKEVQKIYPEMERPSKVKTNQIGAFAERRFCESD